MQGFASSRFTIVRQIGEGGMGAVFEAVDVERRARVALKTMLRQSPDAVVRFKREFRALQDLHHTNLVRLGELVSEGEHLFFTMELVHGEDFLEHVRPSVIVRGPEAREGAPAHASLVNEPTVPFRRAGESAPEPALLDVERLRAALPQLARGLLALHAAGKVHRDVKPSNVRVTPEGRVVLLDFGLIVERTAQHASTHANVVGTPAYMAPEQASSDLGPEADWYAFGVMLYEALTGRLPFGGAPLQMLLEKQRAPPPAPRGVASGVPDDLDDLCVRLLAIDPSRRPTGSEVLRILGECGTPSAVPSHPGGTSAAPFIGREPELQVLRDAFAHVREGRAASVLIQGESGVGKTCLVRRFTEEIAREVPEHLLVTGRCYERESVPYKALDGVVDVLAQALARMSDAKAAELLPDHGAALTKLFPALRRVRVFAALPDARVHDAHEIRRRAFAGLRQLLTRVAMRRPLVIVIDDVQWADEESAPLLEEILRPPEPPPLLLVMTARAAASSSPSVPAALVAALGGTNTVHVTVERLPQSDAEALAAELLGPSARDAGAAKALAAESGGHPLFLDALVRHAATEGIADGHADGATRLDEALLHRAARLPAQARWVLDLVVVAGTPISQECVAHAAAIDLGDLEHIVATLRAANLISTRGARPTDAIEPYHDRVREALGGRLAPEARAHAHKALALALEVASSDVESLATHWAAAGDRARAARYSCESAVQASRALASDRAADWWRRALQYSDSQESEKRQLRLRLAESLADAGRGTDAAEQYQAAARDAPNASEALELRRRAAEQLLRAGHFDRGLAAAREVAEAVGLSLPRSPRTALVQLLFWRLVLAIRRFRFRAREASEISARVLTRIDTAWALALGLAFTEHLYGQLFNTRMLLLALRSGERARIARALALEGGLHGARGRVGWTTCERLLARSEDLARRAGSPQALAWLRVCRGAALFLNGRYVESRRELEEGLSAWGSVLGPANEVVNAKVFHLNTLAYLGDFAELSRRVGEYLREARDRGDIFATVVFRTGYPNLAWLVADDVEGARAQIRAALAEWSKQGFHIEHYYAMFADVQADLYAGDPAAAFEKLSRGAPGARRAFLTRVQSIRIHLAWMFGRAAVAVAERSEVGRAEHLARAEREAAAMDREGQEVGCAHAALVRAGALRLRGDIARARAELRDATEALDAAQVRLHAATSRACEGVLVGGEEGAALVAAAEEVLRAQAVRRPDLFMRMVAPGFGFALSGERP